MLRATNTYLLLLFCASFRGNGVYAQCKSSAALTKTITRLDERLAAVERDDERSKTDERINAMASLVAEIKAELNTLKSSANSYQTSVEQLKSQSAQQNTEISTIRASAKNFIDRTTCKAAVEFSAGLKVTATVANDQTVVYSRVMTSVGGGYNENTGIFTCQVPGVYTFNLESLSVHDQRVALIIHHNNNKVARLFSSEGNGYVSSSTSAMIRLDIGDTVQVKAQGQARMLDSEHVPHNIFSGIRIPDLTQDCA